MRIFLDTSKVSEIEKYLRQGVVDGVTTNPSIMLKDGHRDLRAGVRDIADLIAPRPLSVEVLSSDPHEILDQARTFAGWGKNIVVKVAVISENGESRLESVNTLENEGISVNCTACMSFGQAMLAAKAGATYVSLFVGRINDEGNDGPGVVRVTRQWLDAWDYKANIIVGSIRSTMDIQQAALAGAHVITIPPEFMGRLVDHRYSRATVQQFLNDGQEAFGRAETRVGRT